MVAHGLILVGALLLFGYGRLDGIWLGLIGMFLLSAVQASVLQSRLQESLEGVPVARAMRTEFPRLALDELLSDVVGGRILAKGEACFIVEEGGWPRGLLTEERILSVPGERWREMTAGEAMIPFDALPVVAPGESLLRALQALEESGTSGWLAVMKAGEFVGLLHRDDLQRWAQLRMRFAADGRSA